MKGTDLDQRIRQHFETFFAEHPCEEQVWTLGPAVEALPRLRVLAFEPGPRIGLWVYATVGAWEAREPRLEFVLIAPEQDLKHVELLFMTAWYHGRRGLDEGHTFPIGEPWLPESPCTHFLVSRPYPFATEFETIAIPEGSVLVVWLLPITEAERDFKVREGQEALEQRFEDHSIEFWDPFRGSVVP